jgi:hypothetical protein
MNGTTEIVDLFAVFGALAALASLMVWMTPHSAQYVANCLWRRAVALEAARRLYARVWGEQHVGYHRDRADEAVRNVGGTVVEALCDTSDKMSTWDELISKDKNAHPKDCAVHFGSACDC